MDDRLKESLSAMFDDEADELAVRRVLALGDDNQVQAQWIRWQRLSEQLQSSHAYREAVDLRAGIWAQLDENIEAPARPQSTHSSNSAARLRARPAWHGSGFAALAAMLVVAVVVGFGAGQQWRYDVPAAEFATAGSAQSPENPGNPDAERVPQVALGKLDAAQRAELSNYLLRHARHNSAAAGNGAVGFARVASVSMSGAER